MKRTAIVLGIAALALSLLGVGSAATARLAGSLDPSFGSGGVVTDSSFGDWIAGIAVLPDGKIVVAGTNVTALDGGYDHAFLLARYLPDGSLDPSFGDGGYVVTQAGVAAAGGSFAEALSLQPDGKIVVAGYATQSDGSTDFALARYNADGSLDTGFGAGGVTNTAIPGPEGSSEFIAFADALAVLPGGEILAAGSANDGDPTGASGSFVLAEYEADGSLDPAFGQGGIAQTSFAEKYGVDGGNSAIAAIGVQPDGKIVASGTSGAAGHGLDDQTMALTRYEPDGSLDKSFGLKMTNPRLHYTGGPLAIQHREILVTGASCSKACDGYPPARWSPVLVRYQPDGHRVSTFGNHGFVHLTRFSGVPTAVVAQPDGKILLAVRKGDPWLRPSAGTLVRLLPDGRPDKSFGSRGAVRFPASISALALQSDRKVLVGGSRPDGGMLARVIGGNNCVVPRLRNKTVSKATAELKDSFCRRGRLSKRFSNKVTRGRVISTAPPSGARLASGGRVDLIVSRGKHS